MKTIRRSLSEEKLNRAMHVFWKRGTTIAFLVDAVHGLMAPARSPAPRAAVPHYVDGVEGFLRSL